MGGIPQDPSGLGWAPSRACSAADEASGGALAVRCAPGSLPHYLSSCSRLTGAGRQLYSERKSEASKTFWARAPNCHPVVIPLCDGRKGVGLWMGTAVKITPPRACAARKNEESLVFLQSGPFCLFLQEVYVTVILVKKLVQSLKATKWLGWGAYPPPAQNGGRAPLPPQAPRCSQGFGNLLGVSQVRLLQNSFEISIHLGLFTLGIIPCREL